MSPIEELLNRLEKEVELNNKKKPRVRVYRFFYYVLLIGIILGFSVTIGFVMTSDQSQASSWFLTKIAVAFALGSMALSYFQYLGFGNNVSYEKDIDRIKYILSISTITTLIESKNIPADTKEELIREVIENM